MIRPPPRSPLFPYTTRFRSYMRDAQDPPAPQAGTDPPELEAPARSLRDYLPAVSLRLPARPALPAAGPAPQDRKSTRLNSSHANISYAVFCLKKKKNKSILH